MITANRDKKATYLSVLNLSDKRFVQLETKDMSGVSTNDKTPWAIASVDTAYRAKRNMPGGYADLYRHRHSKWHELSYRRESIL